MCNTFPAFLLLWRVQRWERLKHRWERLPKTHKIGFQGKVLHIYGCLIMSKKGVAPSRKLLHTSPLIWFVWSFASCLWIFTECVYLDNISKLHGGINKLAKTLQPPDVMMMMIINYDDDKSWWWWLWSPKDPPDSVGNDLRISRCVYLDLIWNQFLRDIVPNHI